MAEPACVRHAEERLRRLVAERAVAPDPFAAGLALPGRPGQHHRLCDDGVVARDRDAALATTRWYPPRATCSVQVIGIRSPTRRRGVERHAPRPAVSVGARGEVLGRRDPGHRRRRSGAGVGAGVGARKTGRGKVGAGRRRGLAPMRTWSTTSPNELGRCCCGPGQHHAPDDADDHRAITATIATRGTAGRPGRPDPRPPAPACPRQGGR